MATFGNTNIESLTSPGWANYKAVNGPFTPASDGQVTKLSIYLSGNATAGTHGVKGIIYGRTGGVPGSLLGVTAEVTTAQNQAAAWVDFTFASAVAVLSSAEYYVGFHTAGTPDITVFRYTSIASHPVYSADTYSDGPTDPFGTASAGDYYFSLYATYTPGGGSLIYNRQPLSHLRAR